MIKAVINGTTYENVSTLVATDGTSTASVALVEESSGSSASTSPFGFAVAGDYFPPMPYIIKKCMETTTKGEFTATADTAGNIGNIDTGLDELNFLVVMGKTSSSRFDSTASGELVMLLADFVKNRFYEICPKAVRFGDISDGSLYVFQGTMSAENGVVSIQNTYNGNGYAPFPSDTTFMWFAW